MEKYYGAAAPYMNEYLNLSYKVSEESGLRIRHYQPATNYNHVTAEFVRDGLKFINKSLEAVKNDGQALYYASEELRNDKEVVLQAVKTYGRALEFASNELKNDRQIVLESVKNNGLSLKYASEQLKNDREIIMIAVDNNKEIAKYLNKEILLDHEFLLFLYKDNDVIKNYLLTEQIEEAFVQYAKNDFIIYRYLLKQMSQGNKEIDNYILKILNEIKQKTVNKKEYETTIIDKYRTIALETFKTSKIANNKKVMYGVLEIDPSLFEYLPQEDKDSKEIALKIIEFNSIYFMYLNEKLRADREVAYKSVKLNGSTLRYVSDELKNDRELVLEAIRQQGRFIEYASKELRGDKKLALESLKKDSHGFHYLSDTLKNDIDIVKFALENDITIFKELSEELRENKEFFHKIDLLCDFFLEEENVLFKFEKIAAEKINKYEYDGIVKAVFDYNKIKRPLLIRNRKQGDFFVPLGGKGSKKLKDYFIDKKVSKDKRDHIPLIISDDEIMWVCGYQISDKFKVDENTKDVLYITMIKEK